MNGVHHANGVVWEAVSPRRRRVHGRELVRPPRVGTRVPTFIGPRIRPEGADVAHLAREPVGRVVASAAADARAMEAIRGQRAREREERPHHDHRALIRHRDVAARRSAFFFFFFYYYFFFFAVAAAPRVVG